MTTAVIVGALLMLAVGLWLIVSALWLEHKARHHWPQDELDAERFHRALIGVRAKMRKVAR